MSKSSNSIFSYLFSDEKTIVDKEFLLNIQGKIDAINKSQAVIEFDLDGKVITANQNFLSVMGYSLEEIQGQHHSLFVDSEFKMSADYQAFWDKLRTGQFDSGRYKRIGKNGKEVWLEATYNPVVDETGKPFKFVKFATDITAQALRNANDAGQVQAISKAQAVIEFDMNGYVIDANSNFLSALKYSLEEIKGKHHSLFVEQKCRETSDYKLFWDKLRNGIFDAGQYKRIAKDGSEVWIQASYNPIMDLNGKPMKVVKYATNITDQKMQYADFSGQIQAISKSQAVIEFDLEGKIMYANDLFLNALGYSLDEVEGKHHSIFVDQQYRASAEYKEFWSKLRRGEYDDGEYLRLGKGGREVWIQASYNPILDLNGQPFKVVKYATDITDRVNARKILEQAVEETQSVVAAAMQGELSNRIPLAGKTGGVRDLCEGVNSLMDTTEVSLKDVMRVSSALSQGNLTQKIEKDYPGVFGEVKDALNQTISALLSTVSNVLASTQSLSSAASQVSATAQTLSQGTTEQAASVEQTSASVEQMSASINQNTENAKVTDTMATKAAKEATEGGESVSQTVKAMKSIAAKISIIDDIAYQTNLLALNAAIEAARAGEHGKGFAVVAAEVRKLAERSQVAAQEIGEVADSSVELAEKAGRLLDEIVPSIRKTSDLVQEISAASEEQYAGVSQINDAMEQLNQVTQQGAAASEELAATAEEMNSQAGNLQEMMSFFKVETGTAVRSGSSHSPSAKTSEPGKKLANGSGHSTNDFVSF